MQEQNNSEWFSQFKKTWEYEALEKNPVAYFSAEYALDSHMPTYAGGLGILAGDFIRETAMQNFPLIAVGLFYKRAQSILVLDKDDYKSKLKVVTEVNGQEIIITVPIEHRSVNAKVWQWEDKGAKVYLLDTDIPENDPMDRDITKQLYDENHDLRLKQEIMLGVGGFRLLARLGHHASVYHLNEGHSAFLALELVRHEMEHQHVNFLDACDYAKLHVLFTNHTLVPAGQEIFASEKVRMFIDPCAKEICLNSEEIVGLGSLKENPGNFSMTNFSFKLSTKSNSVSELHLEKARIIWPEHSMDNVTNGVFIPRWDKIESETGNNIWERHIVNKRNLVNFVKEKTGLVWQETDLFLVWARRVVEYKQPLLFFEDIEKLVKILKSSPVPVRIIFSGPTGLQESELVIKIKKIIKESLEGVAVFIPNYSVEVAEILTAGADVWLNTPLPGTEACGTSGMKASLNGALALSTNDGWMHEIDGKDAGWVSESGEMLSILEAEIIPLYSDHLKNTEGSLWIEKMTNSRNLILKSFSTSRMLKEYIQKLYIPILKQKHTHRID